MRWCRRSVMLAAAFVATEARAGDVDDGLDLAYDAPSECEDRSTFVRQVLERVRRRSDVVDVRDPRHFDVRIVREGAELRATLVVTTANEVSVDRTITTETCEQASRAMVLLTALSLDPARGVDAPGASPSDGIVARRSQQASETLAPEVPARPRRTSIVVAFGVDAVGSVPIASQSSFALGGHAEIGSGSGPSLRVTLLRSFETIVERGSNQGRFVWTWGRLDGCPIRFGRRIDVAPCVYGDVGEIEATGLGGETSATRRRPWITLGVLGRVAIRSRGFTAGFEAGGGLSINRESFEFRPAPTVASIPLWVPYVGVTIGAEWRR